MTGKAPIRSIAVAGGGIVGLSAALAFARALPQARVQLVELPVPPEALADRLPGTLPAIRHFHRLVGIEEPALVRQAGANYRLGTRFDQWRADNQPWFHCFGRHGAQVENSAFQHQWLKLRHANAALDYSAYAPAAALAKAGKFVHPADDPTTLLGNFDYALRLDVDAYRALLRERAAAARVAIRAGELAEVRLADERRVDMLRLADGREVRADMFVDCAGPAAPILSRLDPGFVDWSEWLPIERLHFASADGAPHPLDAAAATATGYELLIPLETRTMRISAGAGRETASAQGETIAVKPGRRPESWVGNVVAFGDAAAVVDPLESANLHLAQSAIRRAVSLIPDRDFHPLVLREFNRRTAAEADRVRDFLAVHYLKSSRREGELWSSLAGRAPPESLGHTLAQFLGRGRLPKFEEETFDEDSWFALLFGLGLQPERLDPTALRVDESRSRDMLDRIAAANAALPQALPAYGDYMRQLRG